MSTRRFFNIQIICEDIGILSNWFSQNLDCEKLYAKLKTRFSRNWVFQNDIHDFPGSTGPI